MVFFGPFERRQDQASGFQSRMFYSPENIWNSLEVFLIIATWGVLLSSNHQSSLMLLNIPQYTIPKIHCSKMSLVPRFRNLGLGIGEAPVGKHSMSADCQHMCLLAREAICYFYGCLSCTDILIDLMRFQIQMDITKQRDQCRCCIS